MGYKPEDMISDKDNYFTANGKTIRKGTRAAALANAEIFESNTSSDKEKKDAFDTIKELAPTLIAFGLTKFLTWKNVEIQKIFDDLK